ncbi:MAG: GDSL-type esterase/lipase family protein [Cyanobacteria bacterium J06642_9]
MKRFFSPLASLLAFPGWALLSLAMNGVLFVTVLVLLRQPPNSVSTSTGAGAFAADRAGGNATESKSSMLPQAQASAAQSDLANLQISSQLGDRHRLSYQQWVALLQQEADAIAQQKPKNLSVLLGDSISLWFPPEQLPAAQTWLNQGISGETTAGLLDRLSLLDDVQAETIFLMIGINDLIWGKQDADIIANYRRIVRDLKATHPETTLVVQSILPHAAEQATWEGRDRLLVLPNRRISALNESLKIIAFEEGVEYLDLYLLFADSEGRLRSDLTTDGLHLNLQGYVVWQTAIALYAR